MIDKKDLFNWLQKIDQKLQKPLTLVAVGGTAMTLLGLKNSTIDIDFCVKEKDQKRFVATLDKKYKVDIFVDGYIFSEQLPIDYSQKSKNIKKFDHITLKALHPIDIIITKSARLNARDEEDIEALISYVDKKELLQRFESVVGTYAGDEKEYRRHMSIIVKRFFS